MAGLHKPLERIGAAVVALHRVWVRRIVAPAPPAGEFIDGHEFDRIDAQVLEMIQAGDGVVKCAGRSAAFVRAHMHFVDDQILAGGLGYRSRAPVEGVPVIDDGIVGGVDDLPRAGIAFPETAIEIVFVFLAGNSARDVNGPVPVTFGNQRSFAPGIEIPAHGDARSIRRPHAERDPAGIRDRPHARPRRLRVNRPADRQQHRKPAPQHPPPPLHPARPRWIGFEYRCHRRSLPDWHRGPYSHQRSRQPNC